MTPDEIERIVLTGLESQGVEFKSPGAWTDPALRAQIIRSAIAMANKRDGGVVVVGMVAEPPRPGHHVPRSLSSEQRGSFDPDVLIPQINAHAVPHLEITVLHHQRPTGEHLVVLDVAQFRDYPVLCSRPIVGENGRILAGQGRLLVRSRRSNETTELQAPEDLRELIDLAIDRGLEVYFRRRLLEAAAVEPSDSQHFVDELGGL